MGPTKGSLVPPSRSGSALPTETDGLSLTASQEAPPSKPSATADFTPRRSSPVLSAAASTLTSSGIPTPQLAIDVPVVPGVPFEVLLTDYLMNSQDTIRITSDPAVSWLLLNTAEPPKIFGTVPVDFLGSSFNLTATFAGPGSTYSILFSLDVFRTVAFLTVYKSDTFTIDLVPLLWKTSDYVQSIDVNPSVDWLALDVAERTISAHVPSSAGQAVNITLHAVTELPDMNTPGAMGELLSRDTDEAYMVWLNLDILDRSMQSSSINIPTSSVVTGPTMDAVTESVSDSSTTASPSRTDLSIYSDSFSRESSSSPVTNANNASLSIPMVAPESTPQGSVMSFPVFTSAWSTSPTPNFITSSQEQSDEAQSVIANSTSTGMQVLITVKSAAGVSTTSAFTNVLTSSPETQGTNSRVVPSGSSRANPTGPSTLDAVPTQSNIIPTDAPSSISQSSYTGGNLSKVPSISEGSAQVSTASPPESTQQDVHSSRFVHAHPIPPSHGTIADVSSTSVSNSQSGVTSVTDHYEMSLTASTSPEYAAMTSSLVTGASGLWSSSIGSSQIVPSASVSFESYSPRTSPLVTNGFSSGLASTEAAVSNQLQGDSTHSMSSMPSSSSTVSPITQTLAEGSPISSINNSMLQTTSSAAHHRRSGSSSPTLIRLPSTSSVSLFSSTSIPGSTVSQTPLPTAFVVARDQTLTVNLAPYLANPNDTLVSANTTADGVHLDLDRSSPTLSVSSDQATQNAAVLVRVRGVAGNIYTVSLRLTVTGQTSSVVNSSEPAFLSSTALISTSTGDYTSLMSQFDSTRFVDSSSSVLFPGMSSNVSMTSVESSPSSLTSYSSLDAYTDITSTLVGEASSLITSTVSDVPIPPSTSPQATQVSGGSTAQGQLTTPVQMSSLKPLISPLTSDTASPSSPPADSSSSESSNLSSSSGLSSTRVQAPTPTPPVFEVIQGQSIRIDMSPYLRSPSDTLMDVYPDWVTSDPGDNTVLVAVPADQIPGNVTVSITVESNAASRTYALYVHLIVLQSRTSSSLTSSQTVSSDFPYSGPFSGPSSTIAESIILAASNSSIWHFSTESSKRAGYVGSETRSLPITTQDLLPTSKVFGQSSSPFTSSSETSTVSTSSGTQLLLPTSEAFLTQQSTHAAVSSALSASTIARRMPDTLSSSSFEFMSESQSRTRTQTSVNTGTSSSLFLSMASMSASTSSGPRNFSTSTPSLSSGDQIIGLQTSSIQQLSNNSVQISTGKLASTLIAPSGTYTSVATSKALTSNSSFEVSALSSAFISTTQRLGESNNSTSPTTKFAGYTTSMLSSSGRSSIVLSSISSEVFSVTSILLRQNTTSVQDKSTSSMSPLSSSILGGAVSSSLSSTGQASSLASGASTSRSLALSSTSQYPGGLSSTVQGTSVRASTGPNLSTQRVDTDTSSIHSQSIDQLASSASPKSQRSTSQTALLSSSLQSSTVPSLSHSPSEISSQFSKTSSDARTSTFQATQSPATTNVQTSSTTQMASASGQGPQLSASLASSFFSTPSSAWSSGGSSTTTFARTTTSTPSPPHEPTSVYLMSTGNTMTQQSLSILSTPTQQNSSVLSPASRVLTSSSSAIVLSFSTLTSSQSSTLLSSTSSQQTLSSARSPSSAQPSPSQTTQAQSSFPSSISSMIASGTSSLTSSIATISKALLSATLASSSSSPSTTSQTSMRTSLSSTTALLVERAPTTSSQSGNSITQTIASVTQIASSAGLSSTASNRNSASSSQNLSSNVQGSTSTSRFTSSSQAAGSSSQALSSTSQLPTSFSTTSFFSSQTVKSTSQAVSSSGQMLASTSTTTASPSQTLKSTSQMISSSSQLPTSLSRATSSLSRSASSSSLAVSSSGQLPASSSSTTPSPSQGVASPLSSSVSSQASPSRTASVTGSSNLQSSTSSAVSQALSTLTLSSVGSQSVRTSTSSSQQSTTTSVNSSSFVSPNTLTSTSRLAGSLQASTSTTFASTRVQTSSLTPSVSIPTTSNVPSSTPSQTISVANAASVATTKASSTTSTTSVVLSTTINKASSTTTTTSSITSTRLTTSSTTAAAASPSSSVTILCYDDFNSGSYSNWATYDGTWSAASKAFQETDYVNGAKALFTSCQSQTNFTYDGFITINGVSSSAGSSDGDAGFIFRVTGAASGVNAYNGYYAYINRNNFVGLGVVSQGWKGLTTTAVPIAVGTTYHMRVTAIGANIRVYVTDMVTPKITWSDSTWSSGLVGTRVMYTVAGWDNMTVESPIS